MAISGGELKGGRVVFQAKQDGGAVRLATVAFELAAQQIDQDQPGEPVGAG